jgi:predicted ATP-dependent serine protease
VADAPWRCSECGTVNEPVANACRTCGRWPSLFDLQESTLDDPLEVEMEPEIEPAFEDFEPPETIEAPTVETAEAEPPTARRRRNIGRFVLPLAVVIYLVITAIVNR